MKKILHLCDKHGILKPVWDGSQVSSLKFGPVGEFIVNNVKQEWFLSNVINRDENVYPIHSQLHDASSINQDIGEAYCHVKSLCCGQLPFGVVQTATGKRHHCKITDQSQPHAAFDPFHKTYMRSLLFVPPDDGRQTFYSWQQKRKMWWRKFSSHPGRFALSDIKDDVPSDVKTSENSDLRVSILAEFDCGSATIETIHLSPLSSLDFHESIEEVLKVKDGRKAVLPLVVECSLSLDVATLAFLCDAYSDASKRQLLRLHRRLAPFKAGFVIDVQDSADADRLLDVAKHLSRSLRQRGLSTMLLPDVSKKTHNSQLARNDEIGIPFTIVLSNSTLNDGIIRLYSRETTLKEQVHISKLPDYMQLLVKNY